MQQPVNITNWQKMMTRQALLFSGRRDYWFAIRSEHVNFMQWNVGWKEFPYDLFVASDFKYSRFVGGLLVVAADDRIAVV